MSATELKTFPTDVPGLDEVFGGGLWQGSLYLLEGLPGTGKTILANQIAFGKAASGKNVLYVSLISESHGKLIHHLRGMEFFDEALVESRVYYVSAYRSLVDEGLPGLLEFLVGHARDRAPALLVIEGFSSAEYLKHNVLDLAEFMHQLNALATATRCTTLLVSHDHGTDDHPEHTLVDGVIELSRVSHGVRTSRSLKVHKIRGRNPILGEHTFCITDRGIVVYPRLEAIVTRDGGEASGSPSSASRAQFGLPALDAMLHGGLVRGGTTAILGAPGAGKTLLSAKFLEEGLRAGHRGLYFGFYESPDRLLEKVGSVGIDLRRWVERGALRVLWHPPLEYELDQLAWTLLDAIAEHRAERVVVDGIRGFSVAAFQKERLPIFLAALTTRLRALSIDSVMTEELPLLDYGSQPTPQLVSAVIENAILVRNVEVRGGRWRFVSLLKIRESDYDSAVKEFRITDRGIEVGEPSRDAMNVIGERAGDAGAVR